MTTFHLLIVDDEVKMLRALERALERWSLRPETTWEIQTAESAKTALSKIDTIPFDAVLSDIRIGQEDGVALLRTIKEQRPEIEVVLMTAFATVDNAVEAMKAGARDYLIKPFKMDELKSRLGQIEEMLLLRRENRLLRRQLGQSLALEDLVGRSKATETLREMIRKVAGTDSTVLLRGESGTGKDLAARAIHQSSHRADGPFVTATCSAIPENLLESDLFGHVKGAFTGATEKKAGRFDIAAGGTLYLDEIGDMSPGTQVKLLRVLQHGEYEPVGSAETRKADCRIVAATNRDLEAALVSGRFREDLFYRLNVVAITLPSLRRRKADIPLLTEKFIEKISERRGVPRREISPALMARLESLDWPGNVRQLENAIEYALVMGEGDPLEVEDLPSSLQPNTGNATTSPSAGTHAGELNLDMHEKRLIEQALQQTEGNQTRAARLLGITRRALGYRCAKYGLKVSEE